MTLAKVLEDRANATRRAVGGKTSGTNVRGGRRDG